MKKPIATITIKDVEYQVYTEGLPAELPIGVVSVEGGKTGGGFCSGVACGNCIYYHAKCGSYEPILKYLPKEFEEDHPELFI